MIELILNLKFSESEMMDIIIDHLKHKYDIPKQFVDHIIENKSDSSFDFENGDFILMVGGSMEMPDFPTKKECCREDCDCDEQ